MKNILLAYVAYPVTTAVYFERAFKKIANVKTIGPKLPEHLITQWRLENLKEPINPHDIDVPMQFDMANVNALLKDFTPDLYLWVESVMGYFPTNLNALKCPKACYLIDTYTNYEWHKEWAKNFDYVFLADLSFVEKFRALGLNTHWLPLGCDKELHSAVSLDKKYDVGFVGSLFPNTERAHLLNIVGSQFKLHVERSFLKDMANTFGQSKIIFNNAVGKTDLNMRFFEVMSCGSLLLSDMAINSGQNILFSPHDDYALYTDDKNIIEVVDYYLKDDLAREAIASRGQKIVHAAHTYMHRAQALYDLVFGFESKTPGPEDWRDKALAHIRMADEGGVDKKNSITEIALAERKEASAMRRSFIIPVLDYSPASPYNIKTLLKDLEVIGGEVIVIFNNEIVAEEMKNHPRINRYAVLSQNVGVSRAWSVGLNMCNTDYAFILNADLNLKSGAIDALQKVMDLLPDAACVGPQGSYFNFDTLQDYLYLDKGTFNTIMEVDAISGFLFGVKTKFFSHRLLKFEDSYTPCYFEEWDLGLQMKQHGLKAYVVPNQDYKHEWSGSIRAHRQIHYLEKKQTAKQIWFRNRYLFQQKWLGINAESPNSGLLVSKLLPILLYQFEKSAAENEKLNTLNILNMLRKHFPSHPNVLECVQKYQSLFDSSYQ